ncbi:MAG TPA: SusC/RagA family TonB-linked outer membrane protein [Porphyromonadaceae bacterium]|nr:SusC/RagA family TonB-linked outer membrane protein [Porphyromonadaceae bacterium]
MENKIRFNQRAFKKCDRTLKIMKISFLMLFLCFFTITAGNVFSQQKELSLELNNVTLKKAISEIEKTSDYVFLITDEARRELNRKISVRAKKESIQTILKSIFNDTNLDYTTIERQISVYKNHKPKTEESEKVAKIEPEQQKRTITGTITDEKGEAMIGANVMEIGVPSNGTVTDINGNFSLSTTTGASLRISYIGYIEQEVDTKDKTTLKIVLYEDTQKLDEVVAIGYGYIKKSDLTGSVSSISGDRISAFPTTTLSQSLQGRAAGMQVQQNSGAPGSTIQIRIRGTNSIQGSNEPLWIIDGFPGNESLLNPADIESVEVLKDASATAIYGSRGANGVIIVTTKQGKEGQTKVEYSGSYSVQSLAKKQDMMNAKEYAQLYNIYTKEEQGSEYFTSEQINSYGEGYDWQDIVFRKAPVNNHSVNITGGNNKTRFSLGSSIFDQDGIIQANDYRKITLRSNIDHQINNIFSVSYNVIMNRTDINSIDENGIVRWTLTAPPTHGPYDQDGNYTRLNTVFPFSPDDLGNPVAHFNEISRKSYSNNIMTNLALTIIPLKDLSIKISGNVSNSDSRSDTYTSVKMPQSNSAASIGTSNSLSYNLDNIITYKKVINLDHSINFTGAITYENSKFKNLGASGTGFLSDVTETYNLGSATNFGVPYTSFSEWSLLSYLGRINYSYRDKYLLTMSVRADGSSRYSKGDKWGTFPSAALAWRFTQEEFMKDLSVISNGKFRLGYGKTGSTAISPYYTMDMLSSGKVALQDGLYTFFAPGTRLPANLKWETTSQYDIGLDLGFLNNRFRLTADYYIKNTKDLLNTVQLPLSLGYITTIQNIGEIQNKGFEIQLDANLIDNELKWDVSANIAFNRNKVISLYGGQDIKGSIYSVTVDNSYINLLREGKPLGAFVGYLYDGFDDEGHFKYKDLNDDGKLDDEDRTWIGDPNPNFIYGLNSNLSWKNFNLSLFFQGSQGNDILCLSYLHHNFLYYQGFNTLSEVLYDHWTPDNPNATYPKIDYSLSPKYSDQFVFDGSYLRLKNIELGYNIPIHRSGKNWIQGAYIYMSGQNLLTITSYPWWDPEVNSKGGSNSINQGIDHYSYPTSKGYTFGVKLTF